MIVGFDIGAYSALAALDLDKKVKLLITFRGGLREAIKILREREIKPVIVAVDKKQLEAGRSLAAAFGAVLFTPEEDLSVKEKKILTKGYDFSTDHERDALAAALLAYKHYFKLISKVRKKQWEIFEKIVKKKAPNIAKAMEEKKRVVVISRREAEREIQALRARIKKLEEEVKRLRSELAHARSSAYMKAVKSEEVKRLRELLNKSREAERALASRILEIIEEYKRKRRAIE